MMRIQGTDIEAEQTDSYCMECDVYEGGAVDECPYDPEHPTEAVVITDEAMLPDGNEEHYHHGFKKYVYMLAG
jgi:hypothetical protein